MNERKPSKPKADYPTSEASRSEKAAYSSCPNCPPTTRIKTADQENSLSSKSPTTNRNMHGPSTSNRPSTATCSASCQSRPSCSASYGPEKDEPTRATRSKPPKVEPEIREPGNELINTGFDPYFSSEKKMMFRTLRGWRMRSGIWVKYEPVKTRFVVVIKK